jgi:hypothetical protein
MAATGTLSNNRWMFPSVFFALFAVGGVLLCWSLEGEFRATIFFIPCAVLMCIALVAIFSRRDSFLCGVMLTALCVKLLATWIYTALPSFQEASDVHLYLDGATQLSMSSVHLLDFFSWQQLWGTNFIVVIGAVLFAVTGPSLAAAMVLFSLTGFWGQFVFYRAFVIAFPAANKRYAALLLFFFPSLVYWTAMFGKDAPMLFATSLIAYGVARRFDAKGCLTIFIGFGLASIIRPHIGAFLSVGLFASYMIGDMGRRKIIGLKLLLLPVFCTLCLGIIIYARTSLNLNSIEDARAMSDYSHKYNQVGGSAFNGGDTEIGRLTGAPFLMFRPFPWETNNATAVIASCEGLVLLFLVLQKRASLFRLLANARSNPLVVFTICYFIIFSCVFSITIGNFGLLARQRVMVLPLFLIMLVASDTQVLSRATAKLRYA